MGNNHDYQEYTGEPKKSGSYAYVSDSAYSENVVKWVKSVQGLYHEATFLEKEKDRAKKTMHSTAKAAARVANEAQVDSLYFGHLSARYDKVEDHIEEMQTEFLNVQHAQEGTTITLGE